MIHSCEEFVTRRACSKLASGICGRRAFKAYNLFTGDHQRALWIKVCLLHLRAALARWPGYDVRDLD